MHRSDRNDNACCKNRHKSTSLREMPLKNDICCVQKIFFFRSDTRSGFFNSRRRLWCHNSCHNKTVGVRQSGPRSGPAAGCVCIFFYLHISHLTSLLFERHPPLAARVNTAIRLITALYFTLSPPKGLPAFRLPCTEGWGYCQLAILMRDYLPVTPFHWTQHRYTASAAAFCYTLYRSRHFLL